MSAHVVEDGLELSPDRLDVLLCRFGERITNDGRLVAWSGARLSRSRVASEIDNLNRDEPVAVLEPDSLGRVAPGEHAAGERKEERGAERLGGDWRLRGVGWRGTAVLAAVVGRRPLAG